MMVCLSLKQVSLNYQKVRMTDSELTTFTNAEVAIKFDSYPKKLRLELMQLRELIFETASDLGIDDLEETLKWGQPSYLTKHGSTLRIDLNSEKQNNVAMYFHCKTKLVDTFKEIYTQDFCYNGNRAIVFNQNEVFDKEKLKHCIELSLTYHKISHLPLLGV